MSNITENDVILFYMPRIKQFCHGRWPNLEPEDRESEAVFYFICALRSFPLNCGHFWEDYCNALVSYMDHLNRITPSRYFRKEYSLDCTIKTNNCEGEITLFDILEGPGLDESSLSVESFIKALSSEDSAIIHDLIEEIPLAAVAQKHNLSVYSLRKRLYKIGTIYMEG